uniref:Uncharacterized protein n=1 Tax=Arundo donax TaxID=35708 RepID=A0A0A9DCS1_ARUDO
MHLLTFPLLGRHKNWHANPFYISEISAKSVRILSFIDVINFFI